MKPIFIYKKLLYPLLVSLLFSAFISAQAGDTLRMMHYNLMYYTSQVPSGCVGDEAYLSAKDRDLQTVIHHVLPDILCVCEIGSQSSFVDRFRNNVLNTNGVDYYASCPLTNYSGGTIANMLYYDYRKLTFHSHFYISTSYRDINAYKLYYNSQGLQSGDTVFITFIQAHLKAGSSASDQAAREVQVQKLLSTLEQRGKFENFIFSGDFNFYNASEPAYQTLLHYDNTLFAFYDPVDMEGNWHNNNNFASLHTQSTHTSAGSGECFSTGGLDDRFDFILVSPFIYYGSKGAKSINESYYALGQDGNRMNRTINNPTNSSVPDAVAQALYNASDHLPVIMEISMEATLPVKDRNNEELLLTIANPVRDKLLITIHVEEEASYHFEIFSADGRSIQSTKHFLEMGSHRIEHAFPYPSSFYILIVTDSNGRKTVRKIIK